MLKPFFYAVSLLGTCVVWGRSFLDGSFPHITTAIDVYGCSEYLLPGTKDPLIHMTGIYPIDRQLGVLILFFWEAVDGSHPAASAVGVYFLGQFLPLLTVMFTDGLRKGHASGFCKAIAWALTFQATAIGCSGGIWAAVYTGSSPLVRKNLSLGALQQASLAPPSSTVLLIPAMTLFVALSVAMAIPSPGIVSNYFQQLAIATWNVFPLFVYMLHKTLSLVVPKPGFLKETSRETHLKAIRITNTCTLVASFALHIAVVSFSLASVFFPAIFAARYPEELSPGSIFMPPIAITPSKTAGDGVQGFLQWDQVFGYSVMLIVALLQLETAIKAKGKAFSWIKTVPMVLVGTVIAGPGSACLVVSWVRDEILFQSVKDKIVAKKR